MMEAESREKYKQDETDTSAVAIGQTQRTEEKTTANMAWIDYVAMLEELEYK